MNVVVKLGGAALENAEDRAGAVSGVSELVRGGHNVAVVHGGGAALTRLLKRLGKESTFVNGLRVTDAETRDAALMVFSGLVNRTLTGAFAAQGVRSVGLSGGDAGSFVAGKKPGADLGFVGEVISADPSLIETLWSVEILPVFCSMALAQDGEYYNINADAMAAACAAACRADALFFLTDVDGVRGAAGTVVAELRTEQIHMLAKTKVISGGMLPKLAACQSALNAGVGTVRILPARSAMSLKAALEGATTEGTEVLAA